MAFNFDMVRSRPTRRKPRVDPLFKRQAIRLFLGPPGRWVSANFPEVVPVLPRLPGVYIIYDSDGDTPLYVGQAVSLAVRLSEHARAYPHAGIVEVACFLSKRERDEQELAAIRRLRPRDNVKHND